MAYKKFIVDEKDSLVVRSSTDGYQPKFLVDNKKKFVKVQCQLGNTLRDDWRVEDIASRICRQLNIYAIQQTPCNIDIISKGRTFKRLRVVSDNFEAKGYKFISFNKLLDTYIKNNSIQSFNKMNTQDKIKFIVFVINKCTNININSVLYYIFNMITVDLLVLNQDRHFKNFGIFYNNINNTYTIAMLFDFGMGLFENDIVYDELESLADCLRYSYIAPFGEDPFDMLNILKSIPQYKSYINNLQISKLKIDRKLFIHPASYEYYLKIKKEMEN